MNNWPLVAGIVALVGVDVACVVIIGGRLPKSISRGSVNIELARRRPRRVGIEHATKRLDEVAAARPWHTHNQRVRPWTQHQCVPPAKRTDAQLPNEHPARLVGVAQRGLVSEVRVSQLWKYSGSCRLLVALSTNSCWWSSSDWTRTGNLVLCRHGAWSSSSLARLSEINASPPFEVLRSVWSQRMFYYGRCLKLTRRQQARA